MVIYVKSIVVVVVVVVVLVGSILTLKELNKRQVL